MPKGRPLQVLLVADDPAGRDAVEQALATHETVPSVLTHATTIPEAVARAREGRFDAVLIDLQLPGYSGLRALSNLLDEAIDLPVIALSQDGDELGLEAVRAGAQDYLCKDRITPELLVRAVRYARERQRAADRLRVLAMVDDLTGVYNHRALMVVGGQTLDRARREERTVVVLAICVEGLDAINEEYGYAEGDRALIAAARLLRRVFRDSDVVARAGGNEFIVLGEVDIPSAEPLLQRLSRMLGTEETRSDAPWKLVLRSGAAVAAPGAGGSLHELIDAAEEDRERGAPVTEGFVRGPEV